MTAIRYVPISDIRVSERGNLARDKIEGHCRRLQDDDGMPIDVRQLADGTYVIAGNGRHRYAAYCAEGFRIIPCNVLSMLIQLAPKETK